MPVVVAPFWRRFLFLCLVVMVLVSVAAFMAGGGCAGGWWRVSRRDHHPRSCPGQPRDLRQHPVNARVNGAVYGCPFVNLVNGAMNGVVNGQAVVNGPSGNRR